MAMILHLSTTAARLTFRRSALAGRGAVVSGASHRHPGGRWRSSTVAPPNHDLGDQTIAVHAGEPVDRVTGASVPPLCLSSTFAVSESLSFSANELKEEDPYCYSVCFAD